MLNTSVEMFQFLSDPDLLTHNGGLRDLTVMPSSAF